MEFLKRTFSIGYLKSSNKATYREVADICALRPRVVYMLAHGRHSRSPQERDAKFELMNRQLIWGK